MARKEHAAWTPSASRPDPIALLEASSVGRVPRLIPVRYGRMLKSPFAFLRGGPSIMAGDLGTATPVSGLRVQACGDCHLENFGVFATPERNLIFDINDFDETLVAPWEWDLKRLAASIHVAGRTIGVAEPACTLAVKAAARAYRERLALCAQMTALEVWYSRIEAKTLVKRTPIAELSRARTKRNKAAPDHTHQSVAERFTEGEGSTRRIAERPPLIYHLPDGDDDIAHSHRTLEHYRESLRDDVKVLFDRYTVVDFAVKVVGLGSVGTRCSMTLLTASNEDCLILQVKEARASTLEPYAGKSPYDNHGRRIVAGQQLMQAASDIFLGWTKSGDGREYFVRQLADMKASVEVATMRARDIAEYAALCGHVLAIAHARSGDAGCISGYLGKSALFDGAIARFARSYADQVEADYERFLQAAKAGVIRADPD